MIAFASTKSSKSHGLSYVGLALIFIILCLYTFPNIRQERLLPLSHRKQRPAKEHGSSTTFNRKTHSTTKIVELPPDERPAFRYGNIETSPMNLEGDRLRKTTIITPPTQQSPKEQIARQLSPSALLSRPLPTSQTTVPKLIHQSWSDTRLPEKFRHWSYTCRAQHPDWEWVLWTDADNLRLVEKYAPWFLDTYNALTVEIERVDAARNIYMHVFGGLYLDLDVECLRPTSALLSTFGPSTPTRTAYVGRMGTINESVHSIPNAWMMSTPAHPFWLLPLEYIADTLAEVAAEEESERFLEEPRMKIQAEAITGPGALYDIIGRYNGDGGVVGAYNWENRDTQNLDEHYALSGWGVGEGGPGGGVLYKTDASVRQEVQVLPDWAIYPYSWGPDGEDVREICSTWIKSEDFNPELCKERLGVAGEEDDDGTVTREGSFAITYWSHSWSRGEGTAHDESRVALLNGEGHAEEGGDEGGGDGKEGGEKEGEGESDGGEVQQEGADDGLSDEEKENAKKKQEHGLRFEQEPGLRDHREDRLEEVEVKDQLRAV
ncbi:uncharacterized protein KY384_003543 [Bacidia gigantensis]|uniref:uncharacterized protein n=1 Tax=Bacidia gigantensis TaxID=2732470 RepID=UPI001D048F74|nr:uncharacterized protein KY384_003543 [Bacidia gigantensis]KAG8531907.1 hypothetical protein KY384_003543 [Bacidia gigantensis]